MAQDAKRGPSYTIVSSRLEQLHYADSEERNSFAIPELADAYPSSEALEEDEEVAISSKGSFSEDTCWRG